MTTSRRTPRRRALLAAGIVAASGFAAVATTGPVSAKRELTPAQCIRRNNNTAAKLTECVTVAGVRQHQAQLQRIADRWGGNRAAGLEGYDRSVDYAVRILGNAGYDVTVQPFEFEYTEDLASLTQDAPTPKDYGVDVNASAFTPVDVNGTATGAIVPVDLVLPPTPAPSSTSGCEAADFAGFPAGAIALVQRGTCDFTVKVANAQAAGAAGVVIFNEGQPGREGPFSGIGSSEGLDIPVVFVPFAVGEELYTASLAGPVTVTLDDFQIAETRTVENVLAETRRGNDDNVVMVGAHLDSVQEGPGINDNGSGTAALLEVAENMRAVNPRNTVRFALWGAEESGLLGSEHYVANLSEEEANDIKLYLNFDMIGSPNFFRGVYDGDGDAFGLPGPPGSEDIEATFEQFYEERGLAYEGTEFSGRSDYGPFIDVGIPAGGLFTGAEGMKTPAQVALYGGTAGVAYDPCYHQACDTFGNVNLEVLDQNADAVATATIKYARSTRTLGVGDGSRLAPSARMAALAEEPVNHNLPADLAAA
jgi:Zn-dependent M28 family amino/carboxypeptidase